MGHPRQHLQPTSTELPLFRVEGLGFRAFRTRGFHVGVAEISKGRPRLRSLLSQFLLPSTRDGLILYSQKPSLSLPIWGLTKIKDS